MVSLLLAVIYIAFISLGLPDAILGAAWPVMYAELGAPLSWAGVLTFLIAGGTIVSSLLSQRLTRALGTGRVTAFSVALTAAALLGFSVSGRFWQLCLWSVPYGLGAGSVDAALNNYVALHYKSRHMSWLHCFWGLGAMAGPYVMAACLAGGRGWFTGYRLIGGAQVVLALGLLASVAGGMWKRGADVAAGAASGGVIEAFRVRGVKAVMASMLCYCALESTLGLWASSYLVLHRGLPENTASRWAALFYMGITAGRFFCGIVTGRFGDKAMVRLGQGLTLAGAALLTLLPDGSAWLGLVLLGLGCAPVYPSLIHETPAHFGAARSQAVIGMQMASAYTGSTLMPLAFGFVSARLGIAVYPLFALLASALMVLATERLNRVTTKGKGI